MPAWWGKKSGRTKSDSDKSSGASISSKNDGSRRKEGSIFNIKARSFEDVLSSTRNSPRRSRDDFAPPARAGAANSGSNNPSSGFSGFDSASSFEKAHPLPRPVDDHPGQGQVHASGSGSVSSIGSSSSDEHSHGGPVDHAVFRGHCENRSSPLMRSPGPSARVSTSAPLHTRVNGGGGGSSNLDSPSSKPESHPLPLPPGSPTASLPTPRSPNTSESSCGSNCSKWRKGRLLGRGTFGHVYLGFNSENGQMCAIKEVKVVSDDRSSKESLRQLNQEIALLSQLSHANIVQYYGSDLNDERLSVYLEYVSGGSIHKLLQEYGPFEEPVIQNYTRQILLGLAYLHGRNTAHRDIKGANILVDPNGEIKLADFGMAKHIASCSSMLSFKGSPYWMAPEVVMNTNGYSLPVDIWSLGCTVLEMATSKPPWSQYEGVAAIFKIGNSKDTPEIPEHLSPEAKNFINLCLQREPSSRPTAVQLLSHPFVRNQATLRAANVNITREAFPRAFDGSRTPTASEMHSGRANNTSLDMPRTLTSPRDNTRTITSSLPVSPSSSPLRQADGALYRNFFLSPPHPSYANSSMGQSSRNYGDYPGLQLRPGPRISLDLERPAQLRAQAHAKSPTRMM